MAEEFWGGFKGYKIEFEEGLGHKLSSRGLKRMNEYLI
jgi:hypothetical protein